ncbi:unnamed protein product [Lactuca virosa]|uniref:FAR1 domain-containing protein n=1 Tax=Lactuca virosa TaxID=75947 RepID=A0AAU9NY05_9ASTR|nr:unnamed protein product [Lactuca virosa]
MASFHTNMVFSSRENLTEWVQETSRSLGYVVVIKRTKTKGHGYGYISKIIFKCDRGGVSRGPETSTKNTGSRKTNCPFEIFACL